jgi:hypothetical protein
VADLSGRHHARSCVLQRLFWREFFRQLCCRVECRKLDSPRDKEQSRGPAPPCQKATRRGVRRVSE